MSKFIPEWVAWGRNIGEHYYIRQGLTKTDTWFTISCKSIKNSKRNLVFVPYNENLCLKVVQWRERLYKAEQRERNKEVTYTFNSETDNITFKYSNNEH